MNIELKTFKLVKDQPKFGLDKGTVVYEWIGYDYGLTTDDYVGTGKPHRAISEWPFRHPFYSVAEENLKELPKVDVPENINYYPGHPTH